MAKTPEHPHSVLPKTRLEALTDGIFAFALTLLVLNIEVPEQVPVPVPTNPVTDLLTGLAPDFLHYFVAFIILASFWITHHKIFNQVKYVDGNMLWLNIFSLLFLALIPFSAQLADTYVDYPISAMVFELNILLVGTMFYTQWAYAKRDEHLIGAVAQEELAVARDRILVMPLLSILGIGLAFAGVTWTTMIYWTSPFVHMLMSRKK